MKRLAEVKDSLDIDVKQNFIDPLQGLCDKDLREIQVHWHAVSLLVSLPYCATWEENPLNLLSSIPQTVKFNLMEHSDFLCAPACTNYGFYYLSTTWRSWKAVVWTTITRKSVRARSQMRRFDRPWKSFTSQRMWPRRACTTCWRLM